MGWGLRHYGHLSQTIQGNPNNTDKTHSGSWGRGLRKGLTDHGKRIEAAKEAWNGNYIGLFLLTTIKYLSGYLKERGLFCAEF